MIVADVNLLAYLLIAGPFSEAAQRVFDRDDRWIAPPVWQHELLNVLATSVRAKKVEYDTAVDVWIHAPAFIRDWEVPAQDVLDLAIKSDFATFDCYYVVLARKANAYLVTADKKMLKTFDDVAISIQDFADGK